MHIMNQTIFDFGIIASVILGYFLSTALIATSFYKSRANNYLSLSLFLHTSMILIEWIGPTNNLLSFLFYINLDLVIGVILYTYFLIQIEHRYLNSSWYKWLFVPFICSFVIEAILHLDSIFHLQESFFAEVVIFIKDNISLGLNLFLVFGARILIKQTDTISVGKKRWLLGLNLFIVVFMMSWLFARIDAYTFNSESIIEIPGIIITVLSWWILYYGIFRLQIVVQKDEIHQYLYSKKTNSYPPKKKVKEHTVSKVIAKLYALMDDDELYKDPLLSRLDIATKLGISEGYLSQIINQEINKSVIQFVNGYRIKDAKKLLHDQVFNKYSVEAIGMEVGFKSKSAFYNTFNISLGMSPGVFRKLQKRPDSYNPTVLGLLDS